MGAKDNHYEAKRTARVFIPYEKEKKGPSWTAICITFVIGLWPIGLFLLIKKGMNTWNNKKQTDYRNYAAIISDRLHVSISEFSSKLGKSTNLVINDLQNMINRGYLGSNAYIDRAQNELILDVLETVFVENEPEEEAPEEKPNTTSERVREEAPDELDLAQKENLRMIRRLNDEIADEPVSRRIDRIEELTGSIFSVVHMKPDRLDEVRRFMNYYLPTTLKLLKSYALMEKQSYQGENIVASRKKIENILDTLVQAFEQQLDRLFQSEALDIDADIQVLETMMAKDGLVTPKGPTLRDFGKHKQTMN